jgi:hypothetical protein
MENEIKNTIEIPQEKVILTIQNVEFRFDSGVPSQLIRAMQGIQVTTSNEFLEEARKLYLYPMVVGYDGYSGKMKDAFLEYVEGGYSDTNILDIAVGPVGEAGYNEKGQAFIDEHLNYDPDSIYNFSEPGECICVLLPNGQYEHLIVDKNYSYSKWYPRNKEIALERQKLAGTK